MTERDRGLCLCSEYQSLCEWVCHIAPVLWVVASKQSSRRKGCLLYCCMQVDKENVSLIFISPWTSHSIFGISCLRSTSILSMCFGENCLWLQMRYGWVVPEVIKVVENYWFTKSNNMLCEARGRVGEAKGENLKNREEARRKKSDYQFF